MSDKRAVIEETVEETIEETVEETVIERPYTLRKLKDRDLYPLLQILRKIGIKDFAKEAFANVDMPKDEEGEEKSLKDKLEEVGVSVVFNMADLLIENIGKVSDELYELWSDISGIPAEEIKEMEFGTLPLMIYDSFAEVKNTSFFKVLFKLLR